MGGCGCKKNNINTQQVQQPTNITLTESGTPVVTQPAPAPEQTNGNPQIEVIIDRLNNQ
jgi:hypothetical protein